MKDFYEAMFGIVIFLAIVIALATNKLFGGSQDE